MATDVLARLHERPRSSRRASPTPELPIRLFADRLHQAQITGEHLAALVVWVAATPILVALGWFALGGWCAVGLLAVQVAGPVLFVAARRGRRDRETIRLLPEVIDMLSRSLRSGASLRGALRETTASAPDIVADELRPVVEALDRGRPIDGALQDWIGRSPLVEVRIVASALALASANQAGASQILDAVGQSLRDRLALASEIAALSAQASASMHAMVALPAGFLLLDAIGSQRVGRYLFGQPFGQICLVVGVALNICGWLWMRSLVASRSRA